VTGWTLGKVAAPWGGVDLSLAAPDTVNCDRSQGSSDPQHTDTSANGKSRPRSLHDGSWLGVLQDLKLRNRLNNVLFQLDHSRIVLREDCLFFKPVEGVAEDVDNTAGNIGLLRFRHFSFAPMQERPGLLSSLYQTENKTASEVRG